MPSRAITALFLISLITAAPSCSNVPKGEANAQEISNAFLKLVSEGKLDEAWNSSSTEFKSYMGKEQFRAFVFANPFLKQRPEFEKAIKDAKSGTLLNCYYHGAKSNKIAIVLVGADIDAWRVQAIKIEETIGTANPR